MSKEFGKNFFTLVRNDLPLHCIPSPYPLVNGIRGAMAGVILFMCRE